LAPTVTVNGSVNSPSRDNGTTARTGAGSEEGYLLLRPFQTYRMASAILAKGGSETGSTYHGHHDFMLSDDILRKVHVGHYTFYSKSVVKRPKNYIIVEDCFAQGYVGGENHLIMEKADFESGLAANTLGKSGKSIICVKITGKPPESDILDLTGRFHNSIYDTLNDDGSTTEHYQGSGQVYKELKLAQLEPYRADLKDEFIQRVQRLNTVCFRGMQYTQAGGAGEFKITQLNTGHWGENVYAGVKKVREGENSFMKECNYSNPTVF